MNNAELTKKVMQSIEKQLKTAGYIESVQTFMDVGVLTRENYERWRFGKVDYLERVCTANLNKLSTINHLIRSYAVQHHLKPSYTFYRRYGVRGKAIKLRFSKSNNPNVETNYATRYVRQKANTDSGREKKSAIQIGEAQKGITEETAQE